MVILMEIFPKKDRKIIWGDILEVLDSDVKDRSVNMIFLDPPYNLGKKFGKKKYKWDSDSYSTWTPFLGNLYRAYLPSTAGLHNLSGGEWFLLVICGLLVGIAKTGLSGAAMLVIPVLAGIFGGRPSAGRRWEQWRFWSSPVGRRAAATRT